MLFRFHCDELVYNLSEPPILTLNSVASYYYASIIIDITAHSCRRQRLKQWLESMATATSPEAATAMVKRQQQNQKQEQKETIIKLNNLLPKF